MRSLLRAMVMLTFLVVVPVLWIYRGPLPGPAQEAVDQMVADAQAWWTSSPGATTGAPPLEAALAERESPAKPFTQAAAQAIATDSSAETELAQRMEPLLVQLRRQGASEYALESWGLAGRLFRFTCLLPMAGNSDHVRQFEAIAEDPRVAVEQVLAEATQWRSARSPALSRY